MSRLPSPDSTREELIASLLAFVVLAAACLAWDIHARPRHAVVTGNVALVIVNPPQLLVCGMPGWDFDYLATGARYRAHSGTYNPATAVLEITPAIELCVFNDSFEEQV